MSRFNLMTVFLAFAALSPAHAVLIRQTPSETAQFQGRPLMQDATLLPDDKTEIPLRPVSHGLRKKAVFGLVAVNVYTLQLLASKPDKLVKTDDGILASLKAAGPVQLDLTFLRNIPGERIADSFKEGLAANKIDTKNLSPELAQVLQEISEFKDFKNNSRFTLTFEWNGGRSSVHLWDGSGPVKSISGSAAFAEQLLAIWFGKPADSKLADLKKELIK